MSFNYKYMTKKKKIIVHQFDPEIYPRKLWVCFNATKEVLEEHLEFVGCIDPEWYKQAGAITSMATCKKTKCGGLVVWTKDSKMPVDYISHEATHVAQYIFEYIGEDNLKGETFAYLVGWVAKQIEIAMNYKA